MTETLKEKYAPYFKVGSAFMVCDLETRKELIAAQFNSVTCANEMKVSSLMRQDGSYHFEPADQIVAFARENDMAIHGHNFVWHNQTPRWLFENVTPEELLEKLRAHVQKVKEHFGELATFDAVNEAIEDKSEEYLRDTPWKRVLGDNYISQVFRVIKEVCPNTELYYNDYNDSFPEKRAKIIRMLKELLAEGVPISGMGLQAHYNLYMPSLDDIKRSIEEYATLGLKLRISELDVSMYDFDKGDEIKMPNPEFTKRQADFYGGLFKIYREYAAHIDAVTFWGVTDKDSWLNGFPVPGRRNYPLLFDDNGQPKEAFYRVMDF